MIQAVGPHFKDEFGRVLMLRGVNLSGSSKVPYRPDGSAHIRDGFFDHRTVSFVGRPFPLEEADEHFRRLRSWGFTFLRFLITWEAIEHAGPGIYDEAYLDYLRAVVQKAAQYDISLFIDPHQDVWSRFSGGDGAPGWTLEAVGFDLAGFADSGAAIVHATHGDPFPKMIWDTNGSKLAAATMFTLFFAGNDFAPQTKIDGQPVQEFLQQHYIDAVRQVALRLKGLPNVLGYDTLNEPLTGFIGWHDLNTNGTSFTLGDSPTPFQGMLLGEGFPQEVDVWKLGLASIQRDGTHLLNAPRTRAWRSDQECIWRQHGVWDIDTDGTPRLLQPDYFARVGSRQVDFVRDYYTPFAKRFSEAIQTVDPRALIFVEAEPGGKLPHGAAGSGEGIVFAPHWYDGYVLVKKEFRSYLAVDYFTRQVIFGPGAIRRSFARQMGVFKRFAREELGNVPTLIGEFGIPFDMENKKAFRTGDYSAEIQALDRSFQAIEANLLNCTLWNYTPDNSNTYGDQWNDEDLSIFSPDQQTDPQNIHSGGRALRAAVRPYPVATAGEPLRLFFNVRTRVFLFQFRPNPRTSAPTEIFVPDVQYPRGYTVEVNGGTYEIDRLRQILVVYPEPGRPIQTVRLGPAD